MLKDQNIFKDRMDLCKKRFDLTRSVSISILEIFVDRVIKFVLIICLFYRFHIETGCLLTKQYKMTDIFSGKRPIL